MTDLQAFTTYYLTVLLIGLSAWPLAATIFSRFIDRGWILSKTVGTILVSYFVWLLGIENILSFTRPHTLLIWLLITSAIWGVWLLKNDLSFGSIVDKSIKELINSIKTNQLLRVILVEEVLFFAAFGAWAYVRAFSPELQGLEKFMDYGFMNSILKSEYFPPLDHFFAAEGINYYYFGHLIAAVLTKISSVPSVISYNLQISLLFALTFMGSFSIGLTLIARSLKKKFGYLVFMGGLLSGTFTAIIGNLHAALNITDYKTYWYASATRLIPFTINEFPIYSFVVNDLHGHVSNIPQALLIIALLVNFVLQIKENHEHQTTDDKDQADKQTNNQQSAINDQVKNQNSKFKFLDSSFLIPYLFLSLTIGVSYATNAWDFPIYLVLGGLTTLYFVYQHHQQSPTFDGNLLYVFKDTALIVLPVFILSILIMWPYWQTVAPISEGIGVVRDFSPIGLVLILWGMYFFLSASFLLFAFGNKIAKHLPHKLSAYSLPLTANNIHLNAIDTFALLLMGTALLLIIIPEIIYVKDIYPQHYRANTMFKLYYAAWIMFSIATAYSFTRMTDAIKKRTKSSFWIANLLVQYVLIAATLAYPYFAINSATSSFKEWKGLTGDNFIERLYPNDATAIDWMNENIDGQPTIVEAVGESYTDYARVSTFTGMPTVLGWPVHEWLWRGSYSDPVQPPSRVQTEYEGDDTVVQRINDVQSIYTSNDQSEVKGLLEKYQVEYIYIGRLEYNKYPSLNIELLKSLGEIIYQDNPVVIIEVRG